MAIEIRKEGVKNFFYYADNIKYSASDLIIIFEDNYIKLRGLAGRIVGNKDGYLYSDTFIYDDTGAGTQEIFTSVEQLQQRLIDLGCPAYYEEGDVLISLSDITDVNVSNPTNGQSLTYNSSTQQWENTTLAGGGDMLKSVYDPTNVKDDAFDMENMVEGTTNKIFTATERTKLLGIEDSADVTDAENIEDAITGSSANTLTNTSIFPFVKAVTLVKITWANFKSAIKTYTDTLYVALANFLEENITGTRLTNASVRGSTALDWNAYKVFEFTLIGNTTITDSKLPTGTATKVIEMVITGDYTLTFPAYYEALPSNDTYDGTVRNHIIISCINGTENNEDVIYSLTNLSS